MHTYIDCCFAGGPSDDPLDTDYLPTQRMGYDLMSPEQTQANLQREERYRAREQVAATTASESAARALEEDFEMITDEPGEPVSCWTQTDIWITAKKIFTTTGTQTTCTNLSLEVASTEMAALQKENSNLEEKLKTQLAIVEENQKILNETLERCASLEA